MRESLERRIKTEEMGDVIFKVLIPTERVSEIKRGKKTETTRKFFPGYLIVNMHLIDEHKKLVDRAWYFVRDTPGVIGFAGPKDRPVPMRDSEVESLLAPDARARRQGRSRRFRSRSARRSRSPTARSRTRAASSRRSTRCAASCACPSRSSGAPPRWNSNTGRSNAARPSFLFNAATFNRFMAKEIAGTIKLQIPAGAANPAPPVGPALGQQGVNIMAFCKEFNAATQKQSGDILPVVITVYKDKSFHLHHEVAARGDPAQEGRWHRVPVPRSRTKRRSAS